MRRIAITIAMATSLLAPAGADAAISSVFTGLASPQVSCATQGAGANVGERWCSGTPSRVRSFDGTPLDVSVALPPEPASGADGNFPLIGIYHGWGGSKFTPSSADSQRWLNRGFAVFSMSDRGWGQSCGTAASRTGLPAWASCADGQIHLMDERFEVRDAQFLMGLLADEGVIDPLRIGAQGGSYGGFASVALGTLKDRVRMPDGSLVPWTSPGGTPMRIAAATPGAFGADFVNTQFPNGGELDYVADSPYFGPSGDLRVGPMKSAVINEQLDVADANGYPSAEMLALRPFANGPGPYDALRPVLEELLSFHGALSIDDSTAPAPMLFSNGFSDDFAPADEAIRMYNRIRTDNPGTPVAMFFGDIAHPRSQDKLADSTALKDEQNTWMNYYVKGFGPKPPEGVEVRGITCPDTAPSSGPFHFASWAAVAAGEIRLTRTRTTTVAASGGLYGAGFSRPDGTACARAPGADNPAAANYWTAAASDGGYDIAGSATLLMRLEASGASDQLIARLLDVGPDGRETLISRGMLRPRIGAPKALQLLQLHPNVWQIAPGHAVKLELLPDDVPYSHLNATAPDAAAQHPIKVTDLQLRVPTMQAAGASGGLVTKPLPRYLPPGYAPAVDFVGNTTRGGPDFDPPKTKLKRIKVSASGREATIRFAASDHSGGPTSYECRVDKQKHWKKCKSPTRLKHLKRGMHVFRVRATDAAGNTDPTSVSKQFRVRR
jgi:hypothetical protein